MVKGTKLVRIRLAGKDTPDEIKLNHPFMDKHWLFQNFESMLNLPLEGITSYLESSAEDIAEREQKIEKEYADWQKAKKGEFDAEEAYDLFEIELYNHTKFSELLNNGTLVTIYSLLESNYAHICNMLKMFLGKKIDVSDLSGASNIDKCRRYVEKVGEIDLSGMNESWAKIKKHQLIRNKIVHSNSKIKDIKPDMITFIDNMKGVEYNHNSKVVKITSIDFLIEFLNLVKLYLVGVNEEIIKQTK